MPATDLRRQIRALRRSTPLAERHVAALQLARRVSSLKVFVRSRHIAGYLAVDGELDPAPLLERARVLRKHVYLPVLAGNPAVHLLFAPYHPDMPMQANRFGILEPDVPAAELLPPQRLELVLTPLVAFDTHGTRLGMGGGFYDRTFGFRNHTLRIKPRSPVLMGVAHHCQESGGLSSEAWDVTLDYIATDREIIVV
jgi:5-formyltetrahydrofolate cyclo-ligase